MSIPASTPPLLLSKRLTSFLRANQSAQLPTLLLTTSHGKLLAHASSQPVSVLRTHATVAASLFAIHTSSSTAISDALPSRPGPDTALAGASDSRDSVVSDADNETAAAAAKGQSQTAERGNDDGVDHEGTEKTTKPITITVQLSHGTVVARSLSCGLLFVCVGPAVAPSASGPENMGAGVASDQHTSNFLQPPRHHSRRSSNNSDAGEAALYRSTASSTGSGMAPGGVEVAPASPSDADSSLSSTLAGHHQGSSLDGAAAAAAVVAMRRQTRELARWLDDKLGTLKVPEDGIGT